MESQLADIRDYEQLAVSIKTASDIITKDYLYQLEQYEICEMSEELNIEDISEFTRLFKFKKLVSDKKESMIDKLVTVLNAAYTSDATVIALICGKTDCTDYYLGIVSKDTEQSHDVSTQGETFRSVLTGNFPGLSIEQLDKSSIKSLCDNVFKDDNITSISGIASIRNEKETHSNIEKYVQGIEHLVDSLQGKEYSVLVIADPVKANEIALAKSGYENLYTQLSPFLKTSLSFNESDSITVTQSHTSGVTTSIGESTSITQNYSKNSGWNKSLSQGTSKNKDTGTLKGTIIGAGVAALIGSLSAPVVAAGACVGGGLGAGLFGSKSSNTNEIVAQSGGINQGSGATSQKSSTSANQENDMSGQSEGSTHGRTIQFTNENKTIKNLLNKIDKHLERLEKCESFGAFNCGTYVISSDPETNAIVANSYNALMRGDNSSLQASYINSWNQNRSKTVKEYLKKFSHPLFYKNGSENIIVSPASLANSYEIAVNLGMPKKSINGLPVFESAAFGRNVFEVNENERLSKKIHLGKIFHMGTEEKTEVNLDVKSLAMHTFITGSTGSGKSNTVYQLLRELNKQNVNFLVIEPAKGEYKHIFGNDGAQVYGTNPYYTLLLKINPFKFPKGIHVLEHIDRLIEIFNVCWPMYAAMPAVLKNAVEKSYKDCGWDLTKSTNEFGDDLYPNFADVTRNVKTIIDSSEYDTENKGAYKGSLLTRLNSLTNGINGLIFNDTEISPEELFDRNVIVDLSRVGSSETKSLLMGMIVLKLQEHRMSSSGMNENLKHITVLEEAHNLLKRTSTEQSAESGNLLGKSVEMIANAIAEMRTYGEGFIIADQAPGLLDMAVIRNTNTKIIMRLPDQSDRELVGKSAHLKDNQIDEIARFPQGVAVVYQNNWIEPVLCKIDKFEYDKNKKYDYNKNKIHSKLEANNPKKALKIAELLSQGILLKREEILNEIEPIMQNLKLASSIRVSIINMLQNPPCEPRMTKLAPIMSALFPRVRYGIEQAYTESPEPMDWTNAGEKALQSELPGMIQDQVRRDIIQAVLTDYVFNQLGKVDDVKRWIEEGVR